MKTKKTLLTIVLVIIGIAMLSTTTVQAAYQSVPSGASTQNTAVNWITTIRQMENAGGGMGLQEEIDTETGLATTDANNIDVHLLKNTEYGAILLLGASDYGKQGTDITARRMDLGDTTGNGVQASTTGNKYGIYEMGYFNMDIASYLYNYEWVAGGTSIFLSKINSRYVNRYTGNETSALPGDATTETKNWHGASIASWFAASNTGFLRGYYGSAFSYNGGSESGNYYARAGVVVGNGI